MPVKNKSVLILLGPLHSKVEFVDSVRILQSLGYTIYASPGTAEVMQEHNISGLITLYKPKSGLKPAIIDYLREGKIDLVINVPEGSDTSGLTEGYEIRRTAVDFAIPLISNIKCATLFVASIERVKKFHIKSWDEYMTDSKILF